MPEHARPARTEKNGDQPDPRRWWALSVALVGGFMVLLDVSIRNVALPSIRAGLNASSDALQWVLSGYALAFGLFLVPAGRLGDMRGRRTVFVVALGLFTLASAGCGAAPTPLLLVVSRLIQGFAGGSLTPQISALIQELFRGAERGRAFGAFGTMVGVSTAIGPLLGGLLIQIFGTTHGWRYVFLVNVPIGVIAMILAWRLLPPSRREQVRHDFDPVGIALLGTAVVALLLPLVQEQEWSGFAKWLLIPLALALFGAFLAWERRYAARGREPVVDLRLFQRHSYSFGVGLITAYFCGFTPLFFVFSLFLQNGQHYSALLAGLSNVPFALGSGAAALLGGRLVQRLGVRLVVRGLLAVLLGFVAVWLAVRMFPSHGTGLATALPLLVAGFGSGLVITPNQTVTLSEVPVEEAGSAGGLLQTGQRVGAAVGIAAVGSVFFAALGGQGAVTGAGSGGHHPDWSGAFERGLAVSTGLVVVALVVALVDVRVTKQATAAAAA